MSNETRQQDSISLIPRPRPAFHHLQFFVRARGEPGNEAKTAYKVQSILILASFPGPAQLSVACSMESGRGPGIIYHVSDVSREKGREDLIERRRIADVPTHVIAVIDSSRSRVLVGARFGSFF